ncbi:GNAT family N-acetyltransferase [Winogradskyella sp.]|nr:GNAT family N-acetyltransferase [Winogradskyella sp.]
MKAVELESERLFLMPLSQKHLSLAYVNWLNDIEVNTYLESGGNYTLQLLADFLKEQEQKGILFWAIHLKDSNKHIGNIKIDPINYERNSGEYGILMGDKTNWGKGFANEASNRIIKYCFEELKLTEITLGVIENNIKAVSLYKKMGFVITEQKEKVGIYNNKLSNSLRMSIDVRNFK